MSEEDFISFNQPKRKQKGQKKFVKANSSSFTEIVDDYLENCDDFDELKLLKTTLQASISDSDDSELSPEENYFSKLMEGHDGVIGDSEAFRRTDSEDSCNDSVPSSHVIHSKLGDLKSDQDNEFIVENVDTPKYQLAIWTDDELTQAALELGLIDGKTTGQLEYLEDLIEEIEDRGLGNEDGYKQGQGPTFWAKSIHDPKRAEYELRELEREMENQKFSISEDDSEDSEGLDDKISKAAKKREKKRVRREKRLKIQQQDMERRDLSRNLKTVLDKNRKTVGPEMIQYLTTINTDLQKFCADPGFGDIHILPPMPSAVRKLAVEICKAYHTSSKTRGSGKKKTIMVYRTSITTVPENWKTLVNTVAGRGTLLQGPGGIPKPRSSGKNTVKSKSADSVPKVGDVVGSKAAAITDDNLGHKMMRMMGWSPGESLGKGGNGIVDPIKVIIRPKKAGLGQE